MISSRANLEKPPRMQEEITCYDKIKSYFSEAGDRLAVSVMSYTLETETTLYPERIPTHSSVPNHHVLAQVALK